MEVKSHKKLEWRLEEGENPSPSKPWTPNCQLFAHSWDRTNIAVQPIQGLMENHSQHQKELQMFDWVR